MPEWRRHGLLGFTVNLQGGSPQGYSQGPALAQHAPSTPTARCAPDYLGRLGAHPRPGRRAGHGRRSSATSISARTSGCGTRRPSAAAVDGGDGWLLDRGLPQRPRRDQQRVRRSAYEHAILKPDRVHELIERGQGAARRPAAAGRHELSAAGASRGERRRGLRLPAAARQRRRPTRPGSRRWSRTRGGCAEVPADADRVQRGRPLRLRPAGRTTCRGGARALRLVGLLRPGREQLPRRLPVAPVNWGINTDRKRAFFGLLKEVTGS